MSETSGEFISIGKGAIASEAVSQQLSRQPDMSLRFVQASDGIYDARNAEQNGSLKTPISELPMLSEPNKLAELEQPELSELLNGVVLALEATPYGAHEEMARLVPRLRSRGIITAMASKGFMAEHPEEALDAYQSGYLGIDATLGGNTGIFPFFESVSDERTVAFEGVVNGTFSRMLDLSRGGKSSDEILNRVLPKSEKTPKGEGLAEPGAETVLQVVHGEHGDNMGKAVNAYNFGVLPADGTEIDESEIARIEDAEIYEITQSQTEELFASPEDIAYVVNWHRDGGEIPPEYYDPSKVPGVFILEVGASGLIVGGFRKLPPTSPMHVITQRTGPLNGMAITKKIKPGRTGWDTHVVIGTGAGPAATAHRVVKNGERLRKSNGQRRGGLFL